MKPISLSRFFGIYRFRYRGIQSVAGIASRYDRGCLTRLSVVAVAVATLRRVGPVPFDAGLYRFWFFNIPVFLYLGKPVSRYIPVPVSCCGPFQSALFLKNLPESVHLSAELVDLAFLLVDDGAYHCRVVRWHVLVGEEFHGVAVVFPDDSLVAVHRDGEAGVAEVIHRLAHGPSLEDEHGGVRGAQ